MQRLSQKQANDIKGLDEQLAKLSADYQDLMWDLNIKKMDLDQMKKQTDRMAKDDYRKNRRAYYDAVDQKLDKKINKLLKIVIWGSLGTALVFSLLLTLAMHNNFISFLKIIPSVELATFITFVFSLAPSMYYAFKEFNEDNHREIYYEEDPEIDKRRKKEKRLARKCRDLEAKRDIMKAKLKSLEDSKAQVICNLNNYVAEISNNLELGKNYEMVPKEFKFGEDSLVPHHKNYAELVPLGQTKLVRTKNKKGVEE